MNVTEHFKQRYVERVKGIRDNEMKQYIVQNDSIIVDQVNKLFEFSKLIYTGQVGTDNITRNFYLRDDIIMVANTQNTALITMYKVDFGFPEHTNRKVIKDLLEEMATNETGLTQLKSEYDGYVQEKQKKIEDLDIRIKSLFEQIDILKFQKQVANDEVKARQGEYDLVSKKQQHLATLLCNSIDFRNDLKKM